MRTMKIEDSLFSMWSTMTNWFTPTTLFLILNLMIGTIVLSSKFSKKNPTHSSSTILQRVKSVNFFQYLPDSSNVVQVEPVRSGSILERVKSFNFSFNPYNSEPERENHDQSGNSSDPDREFELRGANNSEPDRDSGTDNPATRDELNAHRGAPAKKIISFVESPAKKEIAGELPSVNKISGVVPAQGKIPGETPVKKMMRSASEKMKFWRTNSEQEKGDAVELRRPATVRGSETATSRDGGSVDSQADDFINKFRQQLKLQRLDSMLRYSDMITRGSSR